MNDESNAPAETLGNSDQEVAAGFIHVDNIFVAPDRQRKNPKQAKPLEDLKKGIVSKGLFHAPVLAPRTGYAPGEPQLQLVAGERRLLAIRELHKDGHAFTYNGKVVPPGYIPFVLLADLAPADLEEAELEENILRLVLPWNEEAAAKLKIHALRQATNPEHTLRQTAKEIVEKVESPRAVKTELNELVMAQTIAPYKDTPMVKGAKSLSKAYTAVIDHQKAKLQRDLRMLAPKSSPHKLLQGDFFDIHKTLAEGSFDVIFSDPPYGIDANKQSFEKKHNYDDSPDYALSLYREIIVRGWKLLKPQGAIFLFCDIEHFKTIRTYAESMQYSTWRTPLIWQKGNEGPAPWGRDGFQRTFELCLYAVKGQRPLVHGPEPDVKLVQRTSRHDRIHAAEKPSDLLRFYLQLSCNPGAKVLDPCAGSGALLHAAKGLGVELTLVEKNPEYYTALCARAQEVEANDEAVEDTVEFAQTQGDLDDEIFGE